MQMYKNNTDAHCDNLKSNWFHYLKKSLCIHLEVQLHDRQNHAYCYCLETEELKKKDFR